MPFGDSKNWNFEIHFTLDKLIQTVKVGQKHAKKMNENERKWLTLKWYGAIMRLQSKEGGEM